MIGDLAVRAEGQRVSRECHGARMDYAEIIDKTGHAAGGLDREAVEHALQATLQTLAERLPRGEARHIMRELPPGIRGFLLAAAFAPAMSTVSSALNSLANVTVVDFLDRLHAADTVRRAKIFTMVWGLVVVGFPLPLGCSGGINRDARNTSAEKG